MSTRRPFSATRNFAGLGAVLVCVVVVLLQFLLCYLNTDSNDEHYEVIGLILSKGRMPNSLECLECYQPRLFYVVSAALIRLFGGKTATFPDLRLVQFMNGIVSFAVLPLIYLYGRRSNAIPRRSRVCILALFAFNPSMKVIAAQVSNDLFSIVFGSLAAYATFELVRRPEYKRLGLVMLFAVLAGISKGTALPIVFGITLVLALKSMTHRRVLRRKYLAYLACYVLVAGSLIASIGGYYDKYIDFGTPFSQVHGLVWAPTGKLPAIVASEGMTSAVSKLAESYFSFDLVNLLEHPYAEQYQPPRHMRSMWSYMYGVYNSITYNFWPGSYRPTPVSPFYKGVLRAIIVLALVPLFFLVTGALSIVRNHYDGTKIFGLRYLAISNRWVPLLFVGLSAAMLVAFDLRLCWPTHLEMKPVYLLPSFAALLWLFMDGFRAFARYVGERSRALAFSEACMWLLVALYGLDLLRLVSVLR